MSAKTLSADDLLHGIVYAVQQAGLLLHDAVGLYDLGRHPSGVVLAVYAREELGRAEILLEQRKRALPSGRVSVDAVKKACGDHVEKLRRGQIGVAMRFGPAHREMLKPLFGGDPQSGLWKKARAFVDAQAKRKARRDPPDTHEKRLRAVHVEPSETGSGWNRPCEMDREEARQLLEDVGNDYAHRRDDLRRRDDELGRALGDWKGRPELPSPIRPSSS